MGIGVRYAASICRFSGGNHVSVGQMLVGLRTNLYMTATGFIPEKCRLVPNDAHTHTERERERERGSKQMHTHAE